MTTATKCVCVREGEGGRGRKSLLEDSLVKGMTRYLATAGAGLHPHP